MPIDREKIIDTLATTEFTSDEQGLLPYDGHILLSRLPARFWHLFSIKILQEAGQKFHRSTATLLEMSGAECAYHTAWHITQSDLFHGLVTPMLSAENEKEETLHGLYAIATGLGWINAEIAQLIPGEKMVIIAHHYDYFAADAYDDFKYEKPFLYRGMNRAMMDLVYGDPYPDGLGKFQCEQTKGIECGDEYGEFIVTPRT